MFSLALPLQGARLFSVKELKESLFSLFKRVEEKVFHFALLLLSRNRSTALIKSGAFFHFSQLLRHVPTIFFGSSNHFSKRKAKVNSQSAFRDRHLNYQAFLLFNLEWKTTKQGNSECKWVTGWRWGWSNDGAHGKETAEICKSFSFAHENCFKVPFDTHFSMYRIVCLCLTTSEEQSEINGKPLSAKDWSEI